MDKKLLSQLTTEIQHIHPDKVWVEQTRHELSFFASNNPTISQRYTWKTLLWPAVLALTVVLLLVFPVQGVLAQSLPGDSLYPLKRLVEQTRIAVTLNTTSKEKLKAHYAETRLAELHSLLIKQDGEKNNEQLEYAFNEVEKSFEETTGIGDESAKQSLFQKALQVFTLLEEASLSGSLQSHIQKLKTMFSKPESYQDDAPQVQGATDSNNSETPIPSVSPIISPSEPQATAQPTAKNETESKENSASSTAPPQATSVPTQTDTSTPQPATPAPLQEEDIRKRIEEDRKREREKVEKERDAIEEERNRRLPQ